MFMIALWTKIQWLTLVDVRGQTVISSTQCLVVCYVINLTLTVARCIKQILLILLNEPSPFLEFLL